MSETKLRPCPFCGYDNLRIDRRRRRTIHAEFDVIAFYDTYSVRCLKCYARGGTASGAVLSYIRHINETPEWATTAEELKKQAIEKWNRRANNE